MKIGYRVKKIGGLEEARAMHLLTQAELAQRARIGKSTVERAERVPQELVSLRSAQSICRVLGIPIHALFVACLPDRHGESNTKALTKS